MVPHPWALINDNVEASYQQSTGLLQAVGRKVTLAAKSSRATSPSQSMDSCSSSDGESETYETGEAILIWSVVYYSMLVALDDDDDTPTKCDVLRSVLHDAYELFDTVTTSRQWSAQLGC